jgi:hypothetical protein
MRVEQLAGRNVSAANETDELGGREEAEIGHVQRSTRDASSAVPARFSGNADPAGASRPY